MPFDNVQSLIWFAPELAVTLGMLMVCLADLLPHLRHRRSGPSFSASAVTCGVSALFFYYICFRVGSSGMGVGSGTALTPVQAILSGELFGAAPPLDLFFGLIRLDPFALFFKLLILVSVLFVVGFSWHHREIRRYGEGEYYVLLLLSTLGLLLMAGASHLLMVYLAIEMVSLSSYALTGFFRRNRKSSEAGLKYVLYGAVASGIMIFGLSYLYGLTGTLQLSELAARLRATVSTTGPIGIASGSLPLILATMFVLGGFAFKIAAFPFHTWCPDVYEGAPTPVTAFLSVAPKVAGFGILIRFLTQVFPDPGLPGAVNPWWPAFLIVASVLTMTWGNLAALGQTNLKRLLAYSAIAHAGYLLIGVVTASTAGHEAVLFYLVAYALMDLGAFFAVIVIAERLGVEDLAGYRGLGWRAPGVAAAMTIFLLSLVGLPPMAGFIGKVFLFRAAIEAHLTWLAVVAVLNSVVSLYYYARVIRAMYFDGVPADGEVAPPLPVTRFSLILLYTLAIPTVLLGIFFGPLYDFVQYSLTKLG